MLKTLGIFFPVGPGAFGRPRCRCNGPGRPWRRGNRPRTSPGPARPGSAGARRDRSADRGSRAAARATGPYFLRRNRCRSVVVSPWTNSTGTILPSQPQLAAVRPSGCLDRRVSWLPRRLLRFRRLGRMFAPAAGGGAGCRSSAGDIVVATYQPGDSSTTQPHSRHGHLRPNSPQPGASCSPYSIHTATTTRFTMPQRQHHLPGQRPSTDRSGTAASSSGRA